MLTLTLLGEEDWDEDNSVFVYPDAITLEFEHSLVSLSKWEQKHKKPFLTQEKKTDQESIDYMHAMLLTPGIPVELLDACTEEHVLALDAYVNDPMTGTTFREVQQRRAGGETISAELIRYWMSTFGIDKSHETDHLNTLFTLIRVHNEKNKPAKKMSRAEQVSDMKRVNEARRAKYGSKG